MDIDHRRIILSFFFKLEGLVVEEWFCPRPHPTLSLIKQNNRSDLPSKKDPSACYCKGRVWENRFPQNSTKHFEQLGRLHFG